MEVNLRRRKGRIPSYIIYSFLWLFFIIIPVITNNYGEEGRFARIYYDWLRMTPLFLVFLINSIILLPKILFRGYTRGYLIAILMTVLTVTFIFQVTGSALFRNDPELLEQKMLRDPQYGREEMRPGMPPAGVPGNTEIFKSPSVISSARTGSQFRSAFQFVNILLISLLIAGFNTAIAMTNRWISEEQAHREAEKEHIRTELAFLQNQISPHFFMNTLNNIHALVGTDTELAQDSILRLSSLMRYLLYESGRGMTTLRKEAEFLRSYVNLMQLRFDRNVRIDVDLPEEVSDINLPPLLFIAFIENAFKHGVSSLDPSVLSFSLRQATGYIEFTAFNTIPRKVISNVQTPGGIGLENIKKRLNLLYQDKYKLDIRQNEHEFRVTLILPV
ncbi:MAG TPA: histidine kinase [Bacteroidales bacterium]|nr:histidine kinase [Bacteroidales bacterium]